MRTRCRLGLVAVTLALLGCGDDQGGSADSSTTVPVLQGLLTEVAEAPADVGATPTPLGARAEGFDHSTAALRVLGDDPRLDELARGCHEGDLASCDDLYVTSPGGSLYETYGATCGARIDVPTHQLCGDVLLGVPDESPPTGDAVLDELASQCAAGDMVDCDLLYAEAPTDSEAERYGATCGGRVETDEDCRGLVT